MSPSADAEINSIDDHVESEIYQCLSLDNPRSFFLYAGAGSGKTRSLVNAVSKIRQDFRRKFLLSGRKLAIITYTNAACDEINSRLDFDPIVEVSTIHSFAWTLIRGHDDDIRVWLRGNLEREILQLEEAELTARASRASNARKRSIKTKRQRLFDIDKAQRFIYNPSGDNSSTESLIHSEVISMTADYLAANNTLQQVLISRFPILFIDESQDTNKHLMDALLQVQKTHGRRFCLGLFGDMMQRIYTDGKVGLDQAIPRDWAFPSKQMNHRCPIRIIELINQIRRSSDGQIQRGRTDKNRGSVRLFILKNELMKADTTERGIAQRMAAVSGDPQWKDSKIGYKTLILEHHMAARRMGFSAMFGPLYKAFSNSSGLLDGSLSGLRFFSHYVFPVVLAKREKDEMELLSAIRARSPLLSKTTLTEVGKSQTAQMSKAHRATQSLLQLWADGQHPTFQQVLNNIKLTELFEIPEALISLAGQTDLGVISDEMIDSAEGQEREMLAWQKMLMSPFDQIESYRDYVEGVSPFGTHQGVKGLEFPRVMVIISDEEARGFLFSYEKLFGAKEKSKADIAHESKGEETTIDRTRRLLYVTCSRAMEGLAIVAYSEDPSAVKGHVIASGWFSEEEIEVIEKS